MISKGSTLGASCVFAFSKIANDIFRRCREVCDYGRVDKPRSRRSLGLDQFFARVLLPFHLFYVQRSNFVASSWYSMRNEKQRGFLPEALA